MTAVAIILIVGGLVWMVGSVVHVGMARRVVSGGEAVKLAGWGVVPIILGAAILGLA